MGKAKQDKDADEGASDRPSKKKNKQRHKGSLMATADRKGGQKPIEGKDGGFPMLDGRLIIFGGLMAYDSKCR